MQQCIYCCFELAMLHGFEEQNDFGAKLRKIPQNMIALNFTATIQSNIEYGIRFYRKTK